LENPKTLIPEGYMVVKETEQVSIFEAPKCLGEATKVALDILDGLFFDALGIHILEELI
jgi:hypothetical protein